ncbi:hypothetical protein FRC01_005718 [Tulasnella sp. 417]|nr:hypothetical protein FRC01_005718 [Tulasnella sp. 417]
MPRPHLGPRAAEENASHGIDPPKRLRYTTGYDNTFHIADTISANPWRHTKSAIKVSPIPLEQFPGTALCPFSDFAAGLPLREALKSPSLPGLASNDGSGSAEKVFGTAARPLSNGISPNEQDRTNDAISRPKLGDINRDGPLGFDCSLNTSALSPETENSTAPITQLASSPCDEPHIIKQALCDVIGPRLGGRDGEDRPASQPGALEPELDTDPRQLIPVTTDPLHCPKENHIPTIAATNLTSREAAPSPRHEDTYSAASPPEHTNAADAFLGVTQTTSRQSDDALERGMVGTVLEVENGLSPWLDATIFGPRAKALVTVLVVGVVFLGAVAKLSREIQTQSSAQ